MVTSFVIHADCDWLHATENFGGSVGVDSGSAGARCLGCSLLFGVVSFNVIERIHIEAGATHKVSPLSIVIRYFRVTPLTVSAFVHLPKLLHAKIQTLPQDIKCHLRIRDFGTTKTLSFQTKPLRETFRQSLHNCAAPGQTMTRQHLREKQS